MKTALQCFILFIAASAAHPVCLAAEPLKSAGGATIKPIALAAPQDAKLLATAVDRFLDEIKAAPSKTIISVTGVYHVKDRVLKADKIVFDDVSSLVFDDLDGPYLAIVAKEIVFSAPQYRARIERSSVVEAPAGVTGDSPTGRPATPGQAANKDAGIPGGGGYAGGEGGKGATRHVPPILLVAAKVSQQPIAARPSGFIDLRLLVDGIPGGKGGNGGNGGQGGDGGAGGNGVSNLLDCAGGPGSGGSGGPGGPGGKGGLGGDGGSGADVYYIGTKDALFELELARVLNRGAAPGPSGMPGSPGAGGSGGPRGSRTGWCNGGDSGPSGGNPNPPNLGQREPNTVEGSRGRISSIEYPVLKLF